MKKTLAVAGVLVVLGFALNAMAFGLSDVKNATGGLSNTAAEAAVNNDIEKKTRNCKFVSGTTEITGCNINDIINSLTAAHTVLEKSGLANDVNVHFKTNGPNYNLAHDRYNALRDKVSAKVGYWDYYGEYKKVASDPNSLKIWVKVR